MRATFPEEAYLATVRRKINASYSELSYRA